MRLTANAIDRTLEWPEWIRRKSVKDRLNYIVRMQSEVCANNWYLWIETAIEASPKLIYSLQAVSKVDVIKEVIGQDYKCGIREMLRNGKGLGATTGDKAKVFLWKIAGLTTRLFWYWLIIEEVTAFIVDWQSIVIQEQHCDHPPHAGPCVLASPGNSLGGILAAYQCFFTVREYDPSNWSGVAANPAVIAPNAVGTYYVGFDVSCVWGSTLDFVWHVEITDGLGAVVARGNDVQTKGNVVSTGTAFGTSTALGSGTAFYRAYVVVTQGDGSTLGHCTQGTFSVGNRQ